MLSYRRARRLLRQTFLTLGVAMAVGLLVFFGVRIRFIMEGWSRVLGLERDVLVTQSRVASVLHSELDPALASEIAAIPGVTEVDPGSFGLARIGPLSFFALFGYEPGSRSAARYRIVEGSAPAEPGEIAVGRRGTAALGTAIGETLELFGQELRVVGLYQAPEAPEELGGLLTLAQLQRLKGGEPAASLFQVGIEAGADTAGVLEAIESLRPGISAAGAREWQPNPGVARLAEGLQWGYAGAILTIAGLVLLLGATSDLFRDRHELATAKAERRWARCLRLTVGRTSAVALLGGVAGVALAVAATEWLRSATPSGAFMEGLPLYGPGVFLRAGLVVAGTALVGAVFPLWTLLRRSPEEIRDDPARDGEVSPQNLRRRWGRGRPSVIGLAIGSLAVAGFWATASFETGVPRQLNGLAGSGPSGWVTVYQRDTPGLTVSSLPEDLTEPLRSLAPARAAIPVVLGAVGSPEYPFFPVVGMPDSGRIPGDHYRLLAGGTPKRPGEMLLGRRAARDHDLEPGDTIRLEHRDFEVSGVFETGLAWEEYAGVLSLAESQRLLHRPGAVSLILVEPLPGRAAEVVERVEETFPRATARISREFFQGTEDMPKVQGITDPVGTLSLLVAALLMTHVLMLSVQRRRPVLRALEGRSGLRRRLFGRFIAEGCLACLAAGAVGILLGIAFLQLLPRLPGIGPLLAAAHWDGEVILKTARSLGIVTVLATAVASWRLLAGGRSRRRSPGLR